MKKTIIILSLVLASLPYTIKCNIVQESKASFNSSVLENAVSSFIYQLPSCPDSLINIGDSNICAGDTVVIIASLVNNKSSLDFGGYISVDDTNLKFYSAEGVSFAFWIKHNWDTASGSPTGIKEFIYDWRDVSWLGLPAHTRYMMTLNNNGHLNWQCEGDSLNSLNNMNYDIASQNQYDNQWINITATINTDSSCLYVNGMPVSTSYYTVQADSFSLYPGGDKEIGGNSGILGYNTDALIDEFQVWTKALSQSEIQQYMAYLPAGNETDLFAYWDFNENTGDTVFDNTANNFKGVITNLTWSNDIPIPSPNTFIWSTGDSTNTIIVNPFQSTTYSVTVSDGITICSDSATIHANPVVGFTPLTDMCLGDAPILLTGGTPTGGTYSGAGINNGIFYPIIAGVGNHAITYIVTDTNSCSNSVIQNISVYPLPSVNFSPLNDVCVDLPPFVLSGGIPAGGSYTGLAISNDTFDPSLAGAGTHTITYSYTNVFGCSNTTTQTIKVNPLPAITFNALPDVCLDNSPITLSAATPSGGVYSGNAVSNGMFDPQTAGTGIHTVTYTYTDMNNCVNTETQTITVNPLPLVNLSLQPEICFNETPLLLTGGNPAGGIYSGPGVFTDYFFPDSAGLGTHLIIYHYIDSNGCGDIAIQSITVNPMPQTSPITGQDVVLQYDTALYSVSQSVGSTFNWMISNGNILSGQSSNAVWIQWGTYGTGTITVVETNQDSCSGDTGILNVSIGNAGIYSPEKIAEIEIYPNPSDGICLVHISNLNNTPISLQIVDQVGRIHYHKDYDATYSKTFEEILNFSGFANGIYFLRLKMNKQVIIRKIVINTF